MARIGSGFRTFRIPQYDVDPSSPVAEDAWVLKSGGGSQVAGSPIGLLLALTYATTGGGYQFSYRTKENTTVRATLS